MIITLPFSRTPDHREARLRVLLVLFYRWHLNHKRFVQAPVVACDVGIAQAAELDAPVGDQAITALAGAGLVEWRRKRLYLTAEGRAEVQRFRCCAPLQTEALLAL